MEATASLRDIGTMRLDLPGYRVVEAVDRPGWVVIAVASAASLCPGWVFSARVHHRVRPRLFDVLVAGQPEAVLVKCGFACGELVVSEADVRSRSVIRCRFECTPRSTPRTA